MSSVGIRGLAKPETKGPCVHGPVSCGVGRSPYLAAIAFFTYMSVTKAL
jgi:hypothetical protein